MKNLKSLCMALLLACTACGSPVEDQAPQAQRIPGGPQSGNDGQGAHGRLSGSVDPARSFSASTLQMLRFSAGTVPGERRSASVGPARSFSASTTGGGGGPGGACDLLAFCDTLRALCPPPEADCLESARECRQAAEAVAQDPAAQAEVCAEIECFVGCGQDIACLADCE